MLKSKLVSALLASSLMVSGVALTTTSLMAEEVIIDTNMQGVLLDKIKNKEIKLKSDISSLALEIDLVKKDTLAKIEKDSAKELADFTERKNDLSFFKEKYKNNMYAKSALVRIEQEEKDLVFMHEKYTKNKTEKIKQLMEDKYIPEEVSEKGKLLLTMKKKLEVLTKKLDLNLQKYKTEVKSAKETLKKANELLLKEINI